MSWINGHYTAFIFFSAGIHFRRQNLASIDVRFRRLKLISTLRGLSERSVVHSPRNSHGVLKLIASNAKSQKYVSIDRRGYSKCLTL